jgi:microcystin-dependent protein
MDPFIGQINIFGFNFAPVGWSFANGSILPIAQNSALFALLGIQFGGNGQNNFQLPDLQGRLPLGMGNGAGLTPRVIGEVDGVENVTVSTNNLPAHNHASQLSVTTSNASTNIPTAGAYLGHANDTNGSAIPNIYFSGSNPPLVNLNSGVTSSIGGNQPLSVMNPFLVLNFCIALQGIFPSRS